MKTSMRSVTVLLAALALAPTTKAGSLPVLANTGENTYFNNNNQYDLYWLWAPGKVLTYSPYNGVGTPDASVLTDQKSGIYYTPLDSQWVWTNPAGSSTSYPDTETFMQEFYIPTGVNLASLRLTGEWGVDNEGDIYLNGTNQYGTGLSLHPEVSSNFTTPHSFAITGGFQFGENTLNIVVENDDRVGGLNVESLAISSVPEPSTALMLLCSLAVGGATYLVRRRGARTGLLRA